MPIWAILLIILVCTVLSVTLFFYEFMKRQDRIEKHYVELSSALNNAINKLEESSLKHENNITSFISKTHEDTEQQLSKLEKQTSDSSALLADSIDTSRNSLLTELGNIDVKIEQAKHKYEGGEKLIVEKIDKVIGVPPTFAPKVTIRTQNS